MAVSNKEFVHGASRELIVYDLMTRRRWDNIWELTLSKERSRRNSQNMQM